MATRQITTALPSAVATGSTDRIVGQVAARLDRLPMRPWHWKNVLVTQLFWSAALMMDGIVLRLYPIVWAPDHTVSSTQYSILVGCSNGFGPMLGMLLWGPLSDRFGRKRIMIASCVICAATVPPLGFVDNFWILLVNVTVTGIGVGGALVTAAAYNVELSPPRARSRLMLGGQVLAWAMLAFGSTEVGVALLPAHPVTYVVVFALYAAVLVPVLIWSIPESPRWLEAHGRTRQADLIVRRVEDAVVSAGGTLADPDTHAIEETEQAPIRELFQGRYLRRTLVLLAVWGLVYIGIDYGWQAYQSVYLVARGIPTTKILPILLVSGIGIMAALFLGMLLGERVERKSYFLGAMVVFCIGLILYYEAGDSLNTMYFASVVTGFGLVACLGTLYNYTVVAFPTRLRSSGVTVTDGVGHLGATFGATIANVFFSGTAGSNYIGWFLWIAIVGALLPGCLLFFAGQRQNAAVLEEISR